MSINRILIEYLSILYLSILFFSLMEGGIEGGTFSLKESAMEVVTGETD